MSLAVDRVNGDVAVLSRLQTAGATTYMIDRVRDGVLESFVVLRLEPPASTWVSPVAMVDGTAVFLIGEEGRGARMMMLGPKNVVAERRLGLHTACTQLVPRGRGYLALCARERQRVMFDADGEMRQKAGALTDHQNS